MTPASPRLGAGPRSLRVKLFAVATIFALLPLALLGVAAVYEEVLAKGHARRLRRAADEAARAGPEALPAIGRAHRVEIARLDARGAVLARARTMAEALERSAVGAVGERLVGAAPGESLEEADRGLGAWPARAEVGRALAGREAVGRHPSRSAETLVVTLARPLPGGGALYLLAGSHRGVRRLVFLRRQLLQLVIYELALALPLLLLFAFRIVRPIERLAAAARRYPAVPLADPDLLRRNDEIATLARVLGDLAGDLERRRREAADLGADIAHEFKNPLASIGAAAELLASSKALTPERVALVSTTIEGAVARLRRSIDELLALLRLEQAVPGEARALVPYAAFLDELLETYRRDPRHAGWAFTLDVDGDVGEVRINGPRWAELLRNLVDNALVQPAARREIVVAARRAADGVETRVRDHGPGVSPENQAKIFQRFFSARPAGVPPGTGLGLSIVETIARAHGGRVAVRSSAGAGAEFVVILPP